MPWSLNIQDVGARFYTYSCTMRVYSMEEAAKKHLPFFVLDRPNPITGVHTARAMLDPRPPLPSPGASRFQFGTA